MRRVIVNFHMNQRGRLTTRTEVIEGDGPVEMGDRVLAYDHDGTHCEAVVENVDGDTIEISLDYDTWGHFHEL